MKKKLVEQLEIRKEWLALNSVNYTKEDFKKDWLRFVNNINESYHLCLISDKTFASLKTTLMDYFYLGI